MAPKGLPDRWEDYSPMGEVISGTRIICMKVPLKQSLLHSISEDCKFSCEHAIDRVTMKGRRLGLVIDLTYTTRYYDPTCFQRANILYKKIFMPGRVIPKKSIMLDFYQAIEDFEKSNEGNNDLIAVHCTHGLNRTGYMVCKYMIERKRLSPDIAISAFEEARGHKIEREIYLADLRGDPPINPEHVHKNRWDRESAADHYHQFDSTMNQMPELLHEKRRKQQNRNGRKPYNRQMHAGYQHHQTNYGFYGHYPPYSYEAYHTQYQQQLSYRGYYNPQETYYGQTPYYEALTQRNDMSSGRPSNSSPLRKFRHERQRRFEQ